MQEMKFLAVKISGHPDRMNARLFQTREQVPFFYSYWYYRISYFRNETNAPAKRTMIIIIIMTRSGSA